MSKTTEEKAMFFLRVAAQQRPYNFYPLPPINGYWLVCGKKWFGFCFGKGGPLVAVCSIRLEQHSPIPIARYHYICVAPQHRNKGLAKALLTVGILVCDLLDENCSPKYSIASMPDGEPEFVRKHLIRFGCKPTTGINTDGLPMLYMRHPLFSGDDSFMEQNYKTHPPTEIEVSL